MMQSRANIIFDLDGTLIDASERLYRLFQDLVPESTFTKEDYWKLKRDKINHCMILKRYFQKENFECFNDRWMSLIESPKYLAMDTTYNDTKNVLNKLSERYNIILLTARQSKTDLFEELGSLGIKGFFDFILVTEHKQTKKELVKSIIEESVLSVGARDLFVSDMGKDIQMGNDMGYKTIAITHGFMSGDRLKEYHPDYMIDELSELLEL